VKHSTSAFLKLDLVDMRVLLILDAFVGNLHHPLMILRDPPFFSHFPVEKQRVNIQKWPQFHFAIFPAKQTTHSVNF